MIDTRTPKETMGLFTQRALPFGAVMADDPPAEPPQYVTLDQAAAWVNRTKRCLEAYRRDPARRRKWRMPEPDVKGGDGRPHEWAWPTIRPWLEHVFGRRLPERLPARSPGCPR